MGDTTLKLSETGTRRNLMTDYSPDDTLISSKSSPIDIYLRVRDLSREEISHNISECIEVSDNSQITIHLPKDSVNYKNVQNGGKVQHKFSFSRIFGPDVTQREFYESTVHASVQHFLWGENCLVFAYGATNSGKTYTVQGSLANDPGILPRALDVVFATIGANLLGLYTLKPNYYENVMSLSCPAAKQERSIKDQLLKCGSDFDSDTFSSNGSDMSRMTASLFSDDSSGSSRTRSYESLAYLKDVFALIDSRPCEAPAVVMDHTKNVHYSVWISFAEIYNEFIYDLLQPITTAKICQKRICLKLAEDRQGNVFVKGLQRVCVSSANEAMKLLVVGQKNLRFAVTKLNQNSSRSHCIFTIEVIRTRDKNNPRAARVNRLSFCDLAGSERYSKTKNTGDRLKEACSINNSLLVLGRCISTLRSNQTMSKESLKLIPFRESKLTRLFQNFFSRRGNVCMIVNISPEPMMCDESLHVLKFSALAEQVVIIPHERRCIKSQASMLMAEFAAQRGSVAWEGTDETDSDDSVYELERDELYTYMEQLKGEILKLRKENITMESRIRNEVVNEAKQAMEETEKYYKQSMEEEREASERRAEEKIAYVISQVTTGSGRKRRQSDVDSSMDCSIRVSVEEFDAEVKKNKELTSKVEELNIELSLLKDELKMLRSSNKRLSVCQAKMRRESTVQKFEESYRDFNARASAGINLGAIAQEEKSRQVLITLEKNKNLTESLAKSEGEVLKRGEEIEKLTALVSLYESSLAVKADKTKRLTSDNAQLKRELQVHRQSLQVHEEEKENCNEDSEDSLKTPIAPIISQQQSRSVIKRTPKNKYSSDESFDRSGSETPDSRDSTPISTVKKLYRQPGLLLVSPSSDEDENINVHTRVLEQLQLK